MGRRTRGTGSVYRPTYRDREGRRQTSTVWWIAYTVDGKLYRQSAETAKKTEAEAALRKKLEAGAAGRPVDPRFDRTTLGDLADLLRADYRQNGRRSLDRTQLSLRHLLEVMGKDTPARRVRAPIVTGYIKRRLDAGAKQATVNRELSALKRMFRLGELQGLATPRPAFSMLEERNRRTGFFEADQVDAVLAHLPVDLQPMFRFMAWTGWRKREVLGLTWDRIDLAAGIVRLEDTKSGEPRTFPFGALPALVTLLREQRADADRLQREKGLIVPFVFHRNGRPIRSYRQAWAEAVKAAGLPGRIPHDFRRTAARNLSRAGVPEQVIMRLCGWKTRSVFDRYRIVSEADLAEGLGKLAAAQPAQGRRRP
jgi:integrase